jgi:DnaK suppressor protein
VDIERYRQRLRAQHDELVERLGREVARAQTAEVEQASSDDRSYADLEKDDNLTLADADSALLKQVVAALIRIENGTYGKCVVDGGDIEEKRLDAVPWTPYCRRHQEQLEQDAGIRTPSL